MTKKNIKPQQVAPVQREINTTANVGGTEGGMGLTPSALGDPIYFDKGW